MGQKLAAQSFRELVVWQQRAMQLTVAIYRLSGDFPRTEQYGLKSVKWFTPCRIQFEGQRPVADN